MSGNQPNRHESVTEEIRDTAALYSAGALEPEHAAAFERHLQSGCAPCRSELEAFQEAFAQIAITAPQRQPSPIVRERLMDRIAPQAPSNRILVRAGEAPWRPSGIKGVTMRKLHSDRESGSVTTMVKVEPGAVYPAHKHAGVEHLYVLEGDVVFQDHVLHAGDYEIAMETSEHSSVTTTGGCMLLIIHNQHDELFS